MEALAAQASAQAKEIKAAETRVMNASLDVEKAYEEQRAKIQSKFKKVSLSLYHVNVSFLFKVLWIGQSTLSLYGQTKSSFFPSYTN